MAKTPTERSRERRKRIATRMAALETAIRAMLAVPRLPTAAREIGMEALRGDK